VDWPTASVGNFFALLIFIILALAAIGYRHRPAVHKRLMQFANITLILAPPAHVDEGQTILGPAVELNLSVALSSAGQLPQRAGSVFIDT
jgi:hypothetical protein